MAVIDCLEDRDETLKRKTVSGNLNLCLRSVWSGGAEVVDAQRSFHSLAVSSELASFPVSFRCHVQFISIFSSTLLSACLAIGY
jgi:hypothetical protein